VSRRDLRRRVDTVERRVDPKPIPSLVLVVPNQVLHAGEDAVEKWFREEVTKYKLPRGGFVLLPEWDEPVERDAQQDQSHSSQ